LKVKICGLTDAAHALAAAEAGADYLGLVFAPSQRQLNRGRAKEIADSIQRLGIRPRLVGVFVNSDPGEINSIADFCQLDLIQLSGKESWIDCLKIKRPIIKALHITPASQTAEILEEIEKGYGLIPREQITFLLDTHSDEGGGSGITFDWKIAREVSARIPIVVAGGLNPQNIDLMIQTVAPWGVDVSSGVETLGKKDINKIREFILKAKSLDSRMNAADSKYNSH
jgi:phosphoribosylanthranilate isomerase